MKCSGKDASGYPKKAIAKSGEENKWVVHRAWWFVLSGNQEKSRVEDNGLVLAHRCARGRFTPALPYACINPWHVTACTQTVNLSHDLDRNSCAQWCRHDPKCIYTNDSGVWLRCRNNIPLQHPCDCGLNCFNEPTPPASPSPAPVLDDVELLESVEQMMSELSSRDEPATEMDEVITLSSD
jgi:hypothetical protein